MIGDDLMVRRRVSAVSNHGLRVLCGYRDLWPILRDAAKTPLLRMR
jgi:hypothetical protein